MNTYESLRGIRPRTKRDLWNYVKVFMGIEVPCESNCAGHNAPLDYLWHAYNTDFSSRSNGDCIVWANRGGGKTEIAAIATLLDCVFKPRCDVRILGGSLEQSGRMYEYLTDFTHRGFEVFLDGPVRKSRCKFVNGSSVEVLPQSSRSIRGRHIHKLRCDEVELFDEQVFAGAKFITQSTNSITGAMEMISTMHRAYGLMQQLVNQAGKNRTPVFKWCIWETIEKCVDRSCSRCPLWSYCGGKAKHACGYIKIDDCITQMQRSSRAAFEAEMLCEKPSLENVVFAEFDLDVHVAAVDYDTSLPLYRAIDFGFVNPFVCLWLQVETGGCVRVIDEYVRTRAAIDVHAAEIIRRTPCDESAVGATFCDPAGAARNDVTGTSTTKELKAMGIRTRYRRSSILEGIELIRRALRAGDGQTKLIINLKCSRLIEAMQCYHYPDISSIGANSELPVKDGVYDHPIDALRYFFVGCQAQTKTTSRRY
jgi:hypothetical protein